jgi:tetratricopeptide (TPR) repeat protein
MALYLVFAAIGEVAIEGGRFDAGLAAWEQAFVHAGNAGYRPSAMLATLSWARFNGSTTVPECIAWLEGLPAGAERNQFVRAYRAWSLAKLGRFDEARAILDEARTQQSERGGGTLLANLLAFESVSVELLAGDAERAAEFGTEGLRMHEELGDRGYRAAAATGLARALYALDRIGDAEVCIDRAAGYHGDVFARQGWRQMKALLLARRGEHVEAETLAREAVALADATEMLDEQGEAYADLAEVLRLGGRRDEEVVALGHALERYERKGNLVMARRTRERLAELRDTG